MGRRAAAPGRCLLAAKYEDAWHFGNGKVSSAVVDSSRAAGSSASLRSGQTVPSQRYQSEPRGLTGASETRTKSGTTESIILDDYAQLDSIPGSIGVVTSRSLPGSAKRRRGLQTAKSGAESACDDKFGETKAKSVIDSRRSAIGVERRAVGTESLGDYFADVLSR